MRLNVYYLISSIMISISVGRPKHREGDVDADYCPKTSMTFVPRHSPVTEFTVLLYPLWWRGRMQASYCCILQLDHTALHAQKTWTWPPVPARRRLPDDHPPHRPPCGSGAKVAGIDLTEMFEGTEYFQFGGSDVLATSSDDEHWKFDAFIKKTEAAFFSLETYRSQPTTEILKPFGIRVHHISSLVTFFTILLQAVVTAANCWIQGVISTVV